MARARTPRLAGIKTRCSRFDALRGFSLAMTGFLLTAMRKERSFRDGLVNGSYPTLCCPSRSLRYGRTAPQRAVQEVRLFPIDGQHTQPLDSIPAVAAC